MDRIQSEQIFARSVVFEVVPDAVRRAASDEMWQSYYFTSIILGHDQRISGRSQLQCERSSLHPADFAPECGPQESLLALRPGDEADHEQLFGVEQPLLYASLWTSG